MSRIKEQRQVKIENLIYEQEEISVKECAHLFKVSEETIRSDFRFLEEKGILQRIHGKARLQLSTIEPSMAIRQQDHKQAKEEIAKAVLPFIPDGSLIYIDAASTSLPLGKLLRLKKNLTIVTNSHELVSLLCESKHTIITLGGIVDKKGKRIIGDFALKMMESLYFDVGILGMDGCRNTDGPANLQSDEVNLSMMVVAHSRKAILLADESKFQKSAYYRYASFSQFDALITTALAEAEKKRIPIPTIIETSKGEQENE